MNAAIEGDLWGHGAPERRDLKGCSVTPFCLRSAGEQVASPVGHIKMAKVFNEIFYSIHSLFCNPQKDRYLK
jgi:hypothetical protein